MREKKNRGINALKSRYGIMFTIPWMIGLVVFFALPLIQSIAYSFSIMTTKPGGVDIKLTGLDNYKNILLEDAHYTEWLSSALISIAYSLPVIILLSVILALMLNQKFRGRLFFRSLYFLPVIIATGSTMKILLSTTSGDLSQAGVSETISSQMINVDDMLEWLQISGEIGNYVTTVINQIFELVWSCGIQIILFLAGLQSIPSTLYEASRVEGATKWEEFWFITFPMLSNVTLLVVVFTMVELINNERNYLVEHVYKMMNSGVYDKTSAMMWFYFLISGCFMGIVVFLYNRFLMRRWQ